MTIYSHPNYYVFVYNYYDIGAVFPPELDLIVITFGPKSGEGFEQ